MDTRTHALARSRRAFAHTPRINGAGYPAAYFHHCDTKPRAVCRMEADGAVMVKLTGSLLRGHIFKSSHYSYISSQRRIAGFATCCRCTMLSVQCAAFIIQRIKLLKNSKFRFLFYPFPRVLRDIHKRWPLSAPAHGWPYAHALYVTRSLQARIPPFRNCHHAKNAG